MPIKKHLPMFLACLFAGFAGGFVGSAVWDRLDNIESETIADQQDSLVVAWTLVEGLQYDARRSACLYFNGYWSEVVIPYTCKSPDLGYFEFREIECDIVAKRQGGLPDYTAEYDNCNISLPVEAD